MQTFQITGLKPASHIHFIGIGGISMSALAEIMLKNGFTVTGSDATLTALTDKLSAKGAKIYKG
ncbi:MAG: UDP-N-acetylmuramate--L-alanine ligase, partial [Hyphomonadaceae bacterium]|nr:UDP-N-acetylmuramate--L-alanine ligase [Clostridia bacterium]